MTARMGLATPLAELTEREFSTQVYDLAKRLAWKRYHTYRSERRPSGYPDETFARDRILFSELKRQSGKPTEAQVEWLTAIAKAGGECYLLKPADLGEFAKVLALRCPPWDARPFWQPGSLWLPAGHRADQQPQPTLL